MKDRNALVLYADNAAQDPVAAAAAIANHFQLPVNPSDVAAIATECAGGGFEGGAEDAWFMSLSDSERAVVEGALDGYAGAFAGGEIGDIIWHRDLFFLYEQPYSHPPPAATRAVDIAGTPRNIIFGPYLSLPPGSWSASVSLVFSREAAELNYTVQISAGTAPLSSLTIKPLPEIVMNANLHFTITEQIDQLLEIYIQSDRTAIDGLVAMLGVVLSPTRPQSANAQAYLTSAPVP
jgi:hypothetical protein